MKSKIIHIGLIGKTKNETVEINSPKGAKIYTVLSVKY